MIASTTYTSLLLRIAAIAAFCISFSVATTANAEENVVKLSLKPVGVEGAHYKVVATPGETLTLDVELSNFGTSSIAAKTFAANAYTLSNGGFGVELDSTNLIGATSWISYPSETLTLEPRTPERRSFSLTVPKGTEPGDYVVGLVIQNAEPVQGDGGININRIVRHAMAVSIDVPGTRSPRLSIAGARHEASGSSSAVIFDVHNTGNQNLRPAGEIVVTDADGNEVVRRQIAVDTFFARTSTTVELAFDHLLDAGDYQVSLTLNDERTGATAHLDEATMSVPVISAPIVETPVGSTAQSKATDASAAATPGGISPITAIGSAAACLVLGIGLTVIVMRLRSRANAASIASDAPGVASTTGVIAPPIASPGKVKPLIPRSTDIQDQSENPAILPSISTDTP